MKKISLFILAVILVMALPLTALAEELATTSIAPGATANVVLITSSAGNGGIYTVPVGKEFVITDVIIFPQSPGAGTNKITIIQNSASREYWVTPNDRPFQVSLTTGFSIAAGYSLSVRNESSSAGTVRVFITGFLR